MTSGFPIYYNDMDLRLEEIIRYLKTYRHVVIIEQKISFRSVKEFHTDHYFHDGLIVRLFWSTKEKGYELALKIKNLDINNIHKTKSNIKSHKILSFSSQKRLDGPNNFERLYFRQVILQGRKNKKYTEKEYEFLENSTNNQLLGEICFEKLAIELNNIGTFEQYLKENKKN